MSRHTIRGREPHLKIVLGWDAPLSTFFTQVWDERTGPQGTLLLWTGCRPADVPTVDRLADSLEPFVTLAPDMREQLARDREDNPGWL